MERRCKTEIVMPLATNLMESTRAIGYSVETAIADIIDNSISANAKSIDLFFDFNDAPYLYIADDGFGMSFEKLKDAMRYGSASPTEARNEKDLGRYGLGMKTASLSQCQRMSVFTKQKGSFAACCWDLDVIKKMNDWSLLILEQTDAEVVPSIKQYLDSHDSCTIVLWENFDKLVGKNSPDEVNEKMETVANHLSLVYHRFISEENLVIRMNNRVLEAADPFLLRTNKDEKCSRKIMDTTSYLRGDVKVTSYILPLVKELSETQKHLLEGDEGLRKNQGFYIYRNKRLLVWGTWFKLRRQIEKSKYARIQVDLTNKVDNEWSLDIKKSKARPPEIIKDALRNVIDKISEASYRQTDFRGRRQVSNGDIEDLWVKVTTRNDIEYKINRNHPLVKLFSEDKKVEILLRNIEDRIPVDALYSDLMEDKKIINCQSEEEEEALKKLNKILAEFASSVKERESLFNSLINTQHFIEHKAFFLSKKEEIVG